MLSKKNIYVRNVNHKVNSQQMEYCRFQSTVEIIRQLKILLRYKYAAVACLCSIAMCDILPGIWGSWAYPEPPAFYGVSSLQACCTLQLCANTAKKEVWVQSLLLTCICPFLQSNVHVYRAPLGPVLPQKACLCQESTVSTVIGTQKSNCPLQSNILLKAAGKDGKAESISSKQQCQTELKGKVNRNAHSAHCFCFVQW